MRGERSDTWSFQVSMECLCYLDTDIVDGSPILDIKPYLPSFDRIEKVKVPALVHQMHFMV